MIVEVELLPYVDDAGRQTHIPLHCGNNCPVSGDLVDPAKDTYPCGYRHWCPWCGDCEHCYDRGPHSWD